MATERTVAIIGAGGAGRTWGLSGVVLHPATPFCVIAITSLDGTHFELAERVRKVESRIAPPGGAAAPYYTAPTEDFSRPGRTWLPTMGQTRFPVYDLVSTWYHEGVPGHHLQLFMAERYNAHRNAFRTPFCIEGWALYWELKLWDLGFPRTR